MKKLVLIILILAVFAMPISASNTWGELWKRFNESEKMTYVYGFAGGITWVDYLIAYKEFNPEKTIMGNFIIDNVRTIKDVMTDLYEDPANSNIKHSLICCLAIKKLKGENIESELERLRKISSGYEEEKKNY